MKGNKDCGLLAGYSRLTTPEAECVSLTLVRLDPELEEKEGTKNAVKLGGRTIKQR